MEAELISILSQYNAKYIQIPNESLKIVYDLFVLGIKQESDDDMVDLYKGLYYQRVKIEPKQAVNYYKRSAEKGNITALLNLGVLYVTKANTNYDLPKDYTTEEWNQRNAFIRKYYTKCIRYLRQVIEKSNDSLHLEVAVSYLHDCKNVDYKSVLCLEKLAFFKGCDYALTCLSDLANSAFIISGKKSAEKAVYYSEIALSKGIHVCRHLGIIIKNYLRLDNYMKAFYYLEKFQEKETYDDVKDDVIHSLVKSNHSIEPFLRNTLYTIDILYACIKYKPPNIVYNQRLLVLDIGYLDKCVKQAYKRNAYEILLYLYDEHSVKADTSDKPPEVGYKEYLLVLLIKQGYNNIEYYKQLLALDVEYLGICKIYCHSYQFFDILLYLEAKYEKVEKNRVCYVLDNYRILCDDVRKILMEYNFVEDRDLMYQIKLHIYKLTGVVPKQNIVKYYPLFEFLKLKSGIPKDLRFKIAGHLFD